MNVYDSGHFKGPYTEQVLSIVGEIEEEYFVDPQTKGRGALQLIGSNFNSLVD